MDLTPIKEVTVRLTNGEKIIFTGDAGAVSTYETYVKDSEGKHHQKVKIVTTTLTIERSDWVRGPKPVGP